LFSFLQKNISDGIVKKPWRFGGFFSAIPCRCPSGTPPAAWCSVGTPTKRQVLKRQVSKRPVSKKHPCILGTSDFDKIS
jgi:hypothetical protein